MYGVLIAIKSPALGETERIVTDLVDNREYAEKEANEIINDKEYDSSWVNFAKRNGWGIKIKIVEIEIKSSKEVFALK